MPGYSGTPLVRKLGLKPNHRVRFVDAPSDFRATLGPLPDGVEFVGAGARNLDAILLFTASAAEFARSFERLKKALAPAGMLWACWPKKASGVVTDLNENVIREIGLAGGLVDVKVCAVDETWSGLKFVIRLADR